MVSDSLISELDRGLRAIAGVTRASRPTPVATTPSSPQDVSIGDDALTPQERRHVAGLMRVNHVGEVCAQALYQAFSDAGHGMVDFSGIIAHLRQQSKG